MPRIPLYEPQVRQAALPSAQVGLRVSPEDFGAGVGQAIGLAAKVVDERAQKALAEQRTARLQDAFSKLSESRLEIERGARDLKGQSALEQDLPTLTRDALRKEFEKLNDELPAEIQPHFRKLYVEEDQSLNKGITAHHAHEADVFADGAYKGTLATQESKAVNAFADPVEAAKARKIADDAISFQSNRLGWSPELRDAERLAWTTKVHLGVLDRLTEGPTAQPEIARRYLEAHRGEIDGGALGRSNIEKVIQAAGVADRARVEADAIWRKADGDPTSAMTMARGIKDTVLYDQVDHRLKQRISEDHAVRVAADSPREARMQKSMYATGFLDRSMKDYQRLSDEGQARVEAEWRKIQRELLHLPASPEEHAAFTTIATDLVDHPEKYVGLDGPAFEREYLAQVAPSDRRALLGHFLQTKGQAVKPDETLPGAVMREIVEVGRRSGAFPPKGDPTQWGERAATHALVVRELLEYQADQKRQGHKTTPEEWTKKVNEKFRKVEVQGSGILGSNIRPDVVPEAAARALPAYQGKEARPATPATGSTDRKRIEAALKKSGFPPTEDFVRWWMLDEQGTPPAQNPPPRRPDPVPLPRID